MTERDSTTPDASGLIFIDPAAGFEIRAISPSEQPETARILAAATGSGTIEAATEAIETLLSTDKSALFGAFVRNELVAAYGIRRDGMANEVAMIAVDKDHRRRGIGRAMLQDALRRSGRRPLVAETDEEGAPFYKACGFKLFGKRAHPSGTVRYRLGWHAPGSHFKGGTTDALTHRGLDSPLES